MPRNKSIPKCKDEKKQALAVKLKRAQNLTPCEWAKEYMLVCSACPAHGVDKTMCHSDAVVWWKSHKSLGRKYIVATE